MAARQTGVKRRAAVFPHSKINRRGLAFELVQRGCSCCRRGRSETTAKRLAFGRGPNRYLIAKLHNRPDTTRNCILTRSSQRHQIRKLCAGHAEAGLDISRGCLVVPSRITGLGTLCSRCLRACPRVSTCPEQKMISTGLPDRRNEHDEAYELSVLSDGAQALSFVQKYRLGIEKDDPCAIPLDLRLESPQAGAEPGGCPCCHSDCGSRAEPGRSRDPHSGRRPAAEAR